MTRPLTKSRYLDGLQCGKLMWTKLHARETVPAGEPWHARLALIGRQLDDLAKRLWEGAVEIPPFRDPAERVSATEKLLAKRVPLFGATFQVDGRQCRVDVLEPAPGGAWELGEIKGGTRIRNTTIQDLAFQRECLLLAGLRIDRIWVMHPDNQYVRGEHLHVHELFRRDDVTERVLRVAPYVGKTVANLRAIAAGINPDTPIGPHCHDPHACRLIPVCWAGLPPDNVTELHQAGRGAFAFLDEGIFRIRDLPDQRLGPSQRIQKQAVVTGRVQIDEDAVRRWLDRLAWPLCFLDFETMAPAVPPFAGTRPYQQVPFQYSLHVQDRPGAPLRHFEYLHEAAGDPRPDLAADLADRVPGAGSVVAWNVDGERLVLNDLAAVAPDRARVLANLAGRLVDLAEPWLSFAVYHPGQHGSTSLKAVLPTVTDLGYDDLVVASGVAATHAYEAVMASVASPDERTAVFRDLRRYCERDTLALAALLAWLQGAGA